MTTKTQTVKNAKSNKKHSDDDIKENPRRYYYIDDGKMYYITEDDDELHIAEDGNSAYNVKYCNFEIGQNFFKTHESLLDYRKKFLHACSEFENEYNYRRKLTHTKAVKTLFKFKSKTTLEHIKLQPITQDEFKLFESCSNGSLQNLDPEYINKEVEAFGVDFPAYYPNLLGNKIFKKELKIAKSEGKKVYFKSENFDFKNIKYGIYNVEIKIKHPKIYKIFTFSKANYYTHYSILFALELKNKYNFDVEIKILNGVSMTWEEKQLLPVYEIFRTWFNFMNELKSKYPNNFIIKKAFSSLWGILCEYKRVRVKTEEDLIKYDCSFNDDDDTEYKIIDMKVFSKRTQYELVSRKRPYKNEICRIKPFLMAVQRNYIGRMLVSNDLLDNTVRIHTDGIVLNKHVDFSKILPEYYPKPEEKTSGKLIFKNVNYYAKYCNECEKFIPHKEKKTHEHKL